jgi:purine-cytosine permease-like protein
MNTPGPWSRILVIVGGIAMLLGAVDPLEGSVLILAGGVLVLVGTFLGQAERPLLSYWIATVVLIAVGVGAMFALSAIGGIGGNSGHSMWWGVLILPYAVGWIMGIINLLIRFVRSVRHRHAAP